MARIATLLTLLWMGYGPLIATGAEPKLDIQRNITFHQANDEKLQADLYRLADKELRPAVVLIHGGGWATGDKWNMADHARE